MSFRNRTQAGRRLAETLRPLDGPDVVVVGLVRGGLAVAAEVARVLDRPLDALVVRKIRVPFAPELAMGAVGEDGTEVIDRDIVVSTAVSESELEAATASARAEAARVLASIRPERPALDVSDKVVFVVDDGVATGSTATAACRVLRRRGARSIILAVPVAPQEVHRTFADVADRVVVVETPEPFVAVGAHYELFPQLTDDDVIEVLRRSGGHGTVTSGRPSAVAWVDETTQIGVVTDHGTDVVDGALCVPPVPAGAVVFVHGSGSSRHSARNIHVARALQKVGFATLLFDLTTATERLEARPEPDVDEAARRTVDVVRWLQGRLGADVPVGLVGSSTGAAVALLAAVNPEHPVVAVASRGGRVDLVAGVAVTLDVPVLLVVGGDDEMVLERNRRFAATLHAPHDLVVVDGATHLFPEPGALDRATTSIVEWFERWLIRAGVPLLPQRH